ncbi:hypothetical protein LINPERPRIM_LOCUS3177 [Linum perenne]
MAVNVAYHVGGTFITIGECLVYEGGEVITVDEVDRDMINAFDLLNAIEVSGKFREDLHLYYNDSSVQGRPTYQFIHDDNSVRALLKAYEGMKVYDIYVDDKVVTPNDDDGEEDSEFERGVEREGDEDSEEDCEFEVGSWISEQDREDLEEIRKKVKEAKENLKEGIPITLEEVENVGFQNEEFSSDDTGYYETIDEDDEVADHGARRTNPLPKYDARTEKPYFSLGMRFANAIEVRDALKKHAIKESRDFVMVKNEAKRIRVRCKWKGCGWTFFASFNKQFNVLQVKKYIAHTCPEHYKNKFVSPKFIAEHYKRRIRSNPSWQKLFWKCAKATTEVFFNREKAILSHVNPAAAESMVAVDPKHWSRAYFSTDVKCDSVDNNMSESFNSLILEARHKPIYSMLEDIRIMCMENIAVKLENYWQIYDHVMQPMDGPKGWIPSRYPAVLPPKFRAMPGRLKKKRVRGVDEKTGEVYRCWSVYQSNDWENDFKSWNCIRTCHHTSFAARR